MLLCHGFLKVSYGVSCPSTRFPIFGAGNHTQILGNFLRNHSLEAGIEGFLSWKLLRGRKPEVSSWFPAWFPTGMKRA